MSAISVVMGRNYTSRLGMIRALGMAGHEVVVIKTDPFEKTVLKKDKIDSNSKYVKEYYCLREPDEKGLVNQILHIISNHPGECMLFPTDDYTASVIDSNLDQLTGLCACPHINHESGRVIKVMDKEYQKMMAQKAGLRVADCWVAKYSIETHSFILPDGIIFPCFVKPQISYKGSKQVMAKCSSMDELSLHLAKMASTYGDEACSDVLIEEFKTIEKEYDIPGLANNTEVILPVFIKKGIIHRGVTGTGELLNSDLFKDTLAKLKVFIGNLNFCGLVDIELYESNGEIYFNELNMRFGASGFALTGSGINLPAALANIYLGETPAINMKEYHGESFASEKVCFQQYGSNNLSWKDFWKTIDEADFNFIRFKDDPKPFVFFKRNANIKRIKKIIVKLLIKRK